MTDIQKAEVTRELVRASDALKNAFQVACHVYDLDLAKDLREQRKALAAKITRINQVKARKVELAGVAP